MLTDAEWIALGRKIKLTPRELQVLRGLFDEQTDAAIGAELGISARTVRAHLESLYRKCNCRTRSGAVASVLKAHLSSAYGDGADASVNWND